MSNRKANHSNRYVAYRENTHPRGAVTALLLGVLSLLLLLGLAVWSTTAGESLQLLTGALGLTAFLLGGSGLVIGLRSFGEMSRSYALSRFSTIFCAIVSAAWFLLICSGIAQILT